MTDEATKKAGNPSSTSRNWLKANKRNTMKKRRQIDNKETKGPK